MRKTKSVPLALLATLWVLCCVAVSWGQSTLGSISGVVTDPSGAVLPGAQVTLSNPSTGAHYRTQTSPQGIYNFRNLPVGMYAIHVEAANFARQDKTGLELFADQAITQDVQMGLSSTQSTVQVTAATSFIDTHNTDLTDVITGSQLLNTPELSRQSGAVGIYQDMYFAPGAQNPTSSSAANGEGNDSGTPVINGDRQIDTMITMDGMTVMSNIGDEGGTPIQPGEEAIQEMHTVLADAPAEFWRPAAVTVVTKSGTNSFHGTVFEDYNGSSLNAKSYFASNVPFRVENNFAASLGGPVLKDKLFFFADYEGGRDAQDIVVTSNVPTAAWRSGNFSGLGQNITNPYTGLPFSGNQIPASMISPVAQNLQNVLFPLPNYGPQGLMSGNFRDLIPAHGSGWTDFDNGDLTLQYNLHQSDVIFVRDSYRELPVSSFDGPFPSVGDFAEKRLGNSGMISENHVFSASLINEVRFGFTEMHLGFNQTANGYNLLSQAGMQGPWETVAHVPAVPSITISSVSGTSGLLPDAIDNDEDFEWNDNLSWTKGRHLLKFGADQIFDHYHGAYNYGNVYGSYNFNGLFTGSGYADFLLGLPQETSLTTPAPLAKLHGTMLGIYAEDQYQISKRVTLNYGLRWEYQGPYSGAQNLLYSFNPANGDEVVPTQAGLSNLSPYFPSDVVPVETAAQAGYPSGSLMFSHYLDFYPRVGLAWRVFPDKGTVLRAAYGIYGNNVYAALGIGQLSNGGPFTGSATYYNNQTSTGPAFSFPNPFVASGSLSTQTAAAPDPRLTVPYTQQWNLTMEQQLGKNGLVSVAYIGTASRNLLETFNLDQPPPSTTPFSVSELQYPNYTAVDWEQNAGVQNFNAFQAVLRKSEGRNLYIDTGLTVAKDLTDDEDTGSAVGYPPENRFCLGCEYGHNTLDRRLNYYVHGNYLLPVGRGQRFFSSASSGLNELFGGWGLAGDASLMSGEFFTPFVNSPYDTANTNTSFVQRPDLIGNPHVQHQTINDWFNINAYAIPGCPASDPLCTNSTPADVGRFGDARPQSLVGPKYINVDLSLMKEFQVARESSFQLRITAQNAFNHPDFDVPDYYVSDGPGVAGAITSESAASLGAREIDIIGRFQF